MLVMLRPFEAPLLGPLKCPVAYGRVLAQAVRQVVPARQLPSAAVTRPGCSVSACEPGAGRIGSWTVTSLVPSGNTHSIWMMFIIAAMPDNTSLVERMVDPVRSDRPPIALPGLLQGFRR